MRVVVLYLLIAMKIVKQFMNTLSKINSNQQWRNMIRKIHKTILRFRIAILHAAYHRNMGRMEKARSKHDIVEFKTYAYRAEDAWRKIVILTEKLK